MHVAPFRTPVKCMALVIASLCIALPAWAQVKLTQGPDEIVVEIDGKPFTVFYVGGKDLEQALSPSTTCRVRQDCQPLVSCRPAARRDD